MNRFVKAFAILVVITMSMWVTPPKVSAQVAVSFQLFYDQLSPYGSWVSYPNYGYVWLPNAGPGFSPYATAGHWVFTEYGWTWVSDYAWGWAAFHYGRWMFDPYYGWLWVPDNVWGPAWVVWRSNANYYGWAPLSPGISINMAFGPGYYIPNDWWVFAPCSHINRRDIYNYYAPRTTNITIINNTTIINRTYVDEKQRTTYSYGPDREGAQKATGSTISALAIRNRTTPGESTSGGQLSIYRPRVENETADGSKAVPKKVTELKTVRKSEPRKDYSALQQPAEKSTVVVKPVPPAKQVQVKQYEQKPANINSKTSGSEATPKSTPKGNTAPPRQQSMRQTVNTATASTQVTRQTGSTAAGNKMTNNNAALAAHHSSETKVKSEDKISTVGSVKRETTMQKTRSATPVSQAKKKPVERIGNDK